MLFGPVFIQGKNDVESSLQPLGEMKMSQYFLVGESQCSWSI